MFKAVSKRFFFLMVILFYMCVVWNESVHDVYINQLVEFRACCWFLLLGFACQEHVKCEIDRTSYYFLNKTVDKFLPNLEIEFHVGLSVLLAFTKIIKYIQLFRPYLITHIRLVTCQAITPVETLLVVFRFFRSFLSRSLRSYLHTSLFASTKKPSKNYVSSIWRMFSQRIEFQLLGFFKSLPKSFFCVWFLISLCILNCNQVEK